MEITPELIIAALSTFGVGIIVPKAVSGIAGYFSGRQARERAGWEAADKAVRERRLWEQWAHRVKLLAIRHGIDSELPPTPSTPPLPKEKDSS